MPDDFDYAAHNEGRKPQKRGQDKGTPNLQPLRVVSSDSPPFFTYLLIGLCVLVTLAYQTSGEAANGAWYKLGHFAVRPSAEIWDGHYAALFTSFFVHSSILHILFNMMWLLRLGRILESTLNAWAYAGFMVVATVLGSGAELLLDGSMGIGASGAVYAMFGLMWAGRSRFTEWRNVATRENLNLFLIWGVFCVFATYTHLMQIANAAHGAGLLFGLAVGNLFYAPRRQPAWWLAIVGLFGVLVVSVAWQPWNASWTFNQGYKAYQHRQYAQSARWYERNVRQETTQEGWHNLALVYSRLYYQAHESGNAAMEKHYQDLFSQAALKSDTLEQSSKGGDADTESDTPPPSTPSPTRDPLTTPTPDEIKSKK